MEIRALVVDDSPAIREFLVAVLNSLDVKSVVVAENGDLALEQLLAMPDYYNLLFLDLHMPGMDGLELLQEVAIRDFKGAIAIISALSPKIISLASEVAKKDRLKIIGSIQKPITEKQVANLLERAESALAIEKSHIKGLNQEQFLFAKNNGQLVPYYQPIVCSESGDIKILECLARIDKPGLTSALTPGYFMHIAEHLKMMNEITAILAERAFTDFSIFLESYAHMGTKLSININADMLSDRSLPKMFSDLCLKYGVEPKQVILEVTERQAIASNKQFTTLNRLRISGFGLALDDYGTGYTNIRQLKEMPYTEIKLDRSLIHHISEDKLLQTITDSLASISRHEHLTLVAEGVEDLMDLNFLICLKPILLQGYLICKPKPMTSIISWARSWQHQNPLQDVAG